LPGTPHLYVDFLCPGVQVINLALGFRTDSIRFGRAFTIIAVHHANIAAHRDDSAWLARF
jgi:hypothetical protein